MDIICHNEPFFPVECAQLLACALSPADTFYEERQFNHIDASLKKMAQKYPTQYPQLRQKLEPLRAVTEHVMAGLTVPEERLRVLFAPPPDCRLFPGVAIAHQEQQSIDKAAPSPEKRHREAASMLQSCLLNVNDDDLIPAESELVEWLEGLGLTAEDKWNSLLFYRHMEAYQAECRAIFKEVEVLYREMEPVWAPILQESMEASRQHLEAQGSAYLMELFHVRFDFQKLEIYPSLTGYNVLTLTADPHGNGTDLLNMGYMLEELLALDSQSAVTVDRLNAQLKAIADKRRLEILIALRGGPLCGLEIAQQVGLTPATVSHHMNELVGSGLVELSKEGTRVNYLFSPEGMDSLLRNLRQQFRSED